MPEKAGLKASLYGTLQNVVVLSPSGQRVGVKQVYDVNLDRSLSVVARTTAGLFRKFNGRLIPTGYLVGAQLESELNFAGAPETTDQIDLLRGLDPIVFYDQVYAARAFRSHEDPSTTVWWHTFYDKVSFLAATLPPRGSDGSNLQ